MVINATLSNSNSSWSVVQVDFTDCQVFELKLFLCCWCCRRCCCCCHTIIWEIIWDFPWEWIWLINPRDHILCCPFLQFYVSWNACTVENTFGSLLSICWLTNFYLHCCRVLIWVKDAQESKATTTYLPIFKYLAWSAPFVTSYEVVRKLGSFRLTAPAAVLGHLGAISLKNLTKHKEVRKLEKELIRPFGWKPSLWLQA